MPSQSLDFILNIHQKRMWKLLDKYGRGVCIEAGPGAGKTTFAARYASNFDGQVVFFSHTHKSVDVFLEEIKKIQNIDFLVVQAVGKEQEDACPKFSTGSAPSCHDCHYNLREKPLPEQDVAKMREHLKKVEAAISSERILNPERAKEMLEADEELAKIVCPYRLLFLAAKRAKIFASVYHFPAMNFPPPEIVQVITNTDLLIFDEVDTFIDTIRQTRSFRVAYVASRENDIQLVNCPYPECPKSPKKPSHKKHEKYRDSEGRKLDRIKNRDCWKACRLEVFPGDNRFFDLAEVLREAWDRVKSNRLLDFVPQNLSEDEWKQYVHTDDGMTQFVEKIDEFLEVWLEIFKTSFNHTRGIIDPRKKMKKLYLSLKKGMKKIKGLQAPLEYPTQFRIKNLRVQERTIKNLLHYFLRVATVAHEAELVGVIWRNDEDTKKGNQRHSCLLEIRLELTERIRKTYKLLLSPPKILWISGTIAPWTNFISAMGLNFVDEASLPRFEIIPFTLPETSMFVIRQANYTTSTLKKKQFEIPMELVKAIRRETPHASLLIFFPNKQLSKRFYQAWCQKFGSKKSEIEILSEEEDYSGKMEKRDEAKILVTHNRGRIHRAVNRPQDTVCAVFGRSHPDFQELKYYTKLQAHLKRDEFREFCQNHVLVKSGDLTLKQGMKELEEGWNERMQGEAEQLFVDYPAGIVVTQAGRRPHRDTMKNRVTFYFAPYSPEELRVVSAETKNVRTYNFTPGGGKKAKKERKQYGIDLDRIVFPFLRENDTFEERETRLRAKLRIPHKQGSEGLIEVLKVILETGGSTLRGVREQTGRDFNTVKNNLEELIEEKVICNATQGQKRLYKVREEYLEPLERILEAWSK